MTPTAKDSTTGTSGTAGSDTGAASTVGGFSSADTSDISQLSYEQARADLVETVSRLETGGAGLEESLALWERGEALADRCEAWLDGARQRLVEVRAKTDRTAGTAGEAGTGTDGEADGS